MAHTINQSAEALIQKPVRVLDEGFVELIDYLGDDQRICEAARVSYANVQKKSTDAFLVDYLMRNLHTSPFEQVVFTFHLKMPIFIARQWVRHRTARINEISGRYSILKNEYYRPEKDHINKQSQDNKQGRGDKLSASEADKAFELIEKAYNAAEDSYNKLLEVGVAREIARIVLPLGTYTEFYWQMDLHNLFHFLALRMDEHAQFEIRSFANAIYDIISKIVPMATAAFDKHVLKSLKLSQNEADDIIARLGTDTSLTDRDERILSEKIAKFKKKK